MRGVEEVTFDVMRNCNEEPLIWKTSGETEASLNMVSASHTIATDAAVFVNAQRLQ
jgi:hypothetical protein